MRFYSDLTQQLYDSEEILQKEEKKITEKIAAEKAAAEKKATERASRAKVIEDKYKEYLEANKKANKTYNEFCNLRNAFVQDYGSFHMSFTSNEDKTAPCLDGLFDYLFNSF